MMGEANKKEQKYCIATTQIKPKIRTLIITINQSMFIYC
jgi:hypothetical protein